MEAVMKESKTMNEIKSTNKSDRVKGDIIKTEYGELHNFKVSQYTEPKNLATAILLCLNEGNKVRIGATGNALRVMLKAFPVVEKHKPLGKHVIYIPGSEVVTEERGKCTILYFTIFLIDEDNSPIAKCIRESDVTFESDNVSIVNDDLLVVDVINNKHLIKETIRYYSERNFIPVSSIPIVSKGNTSYVILTFKRNPIEG